jgi:hypothetical protein
MEEKTMMVSKLSPGVRQFNLLEQNKNKKKSAGRRQTAFICF